MKRNSKQRKLLTRIPFSIAFWSIFALIMIILFFYNRGAISKTITKLQKTPASQESKDIAQEVQDIVEKKVKKSETKGIQILEEEQIKVAEKEETNKLEKERTEQRIELNSTVATESEDGKKESNDLKGLSNDEAKIDENGEEERHDQELQKREIAVYFATVSDSGAVNREKCVRSIEKTSSPMIDSINTLLSGPTKDEAKRGLRSFIPVDTKLLSASIKDGSALLNFSEEFQFNRYGVEGYNVQLQQVVFTACSFPTVKSVQFLIEGQKRDFIGSEGVWIGSPFTPSSF